MSHWICPDETSSVSRFYYFTKTFHTAADATLQANVCGDARYQLYINGHLASEGPCQGSSFQTYYETVELTPYLKAGENTLLAKVLWTTPDIFIPVYRGQRAAFWFDGKLTEEAETKPLCTDASWLCQREDACTMNYIEGSGLHRSLPPFESWNGDSKPTEVPLRLLYEPNMDRQCVSYFGLAEQYRLMPRLIPQMETEAPKPMQICRRGENFIEFDAVNYTTAKVKFAFKAKKGSKISLVYAECYTQKDGEDKPRYKGVRDDCSKDSSMFWGPYDTVIATGEAQSFETYWYRAFRFIRVEFPEDAELEILQFDYSFYHYPLDAAGHFTCSDERFNKMWEVSRNTVLCCMREIYMDCPFYEQQQYQMDSALEMLYTMRMSADTRMPYQTLLDLGSSQLADGMLQANYPSTKQQIIPGFTLFWVLMLRDYLRYAGREESDLTPVLPMLGTMQKALDCFEPLINEQGLVGATNYWHFVDWVPGWPYGVPVGGITGPITVLSLMYAAALHAGAEVAVTMGRPGLAADYKARAERMIKSVKAACYDEEKGLYRDTPTTNYYSQHTTLWAVLSGAAEGEEAGELIDRTFNADFPISVCSFSMSHYMFRALEKAGRYEYATRQLAGWQKMLDLHCTTWCENPDHPRSECHGWSSAPIYEFSAMVLGVCPTSDGYRSVRIKPMVDIYDLDWAKGTVPTPVGLIEVSWEKKDGVLTLHVSLPDGVPGEIILPDGRIFAQEAGERKSYDCPSGKL